MTTIDNDTASDRLLHAIDVSLLLGVPRATLANWRSAGKGPPFVKVGRHVRYRREDVDRWVEAQVVQPREGVTAPR
jgi:excisionase family DNA binding protein